MRIEVTIEDNSPEAMILKSLDDPQAYMIELVRLDRGVHANGNSAPPDYLKLLALADKSPGRFKSGEEVDLYIEELRSEW